MRHNPHHFVDDPGIVRRLIRENPWGILVSGHHCRLVASHYPVLLDEDCDELAVFTHVGRPDDELHDFGEHEIMLIVQGIHGYISASWYAPGATRAPTWNFAVAHCYGIPQVLDEDTNLRTLARLVEHFERHVEEPMLLDLEWGRASRERHCGDPPGHHALAVQSQDEPRQGSRNPATSDPRVTGPGGLPQPPARK